MSQAKVDRYKEEKKNRAQIMKREKRNAKIRGAVATIVCAVVVVWAGYSVVDTFTRKPVEEPVQETVVPETYTINTEAIDSFLASLD